MVSTSLLSHVENTMVIDDTTIDRFIAEQVILKTGFAGNVVSMNSATEALAYLSRNAAHPKSLPQVIFLDINMPQFDGFEFLKNFDLLAPSIKENCRLAMLSSSMDPYDLERARKNKYVRHYVCKPLNKAKLDYIKHNYAFHVTGENQLPRENIS